jgi:hypothetical protein
MRLFKNESTGTQHPINFAEVSINKKNPTTAEQELRAQIPIDLGNNLILRFGEKQDISQAVALFDGIWQRKPFHTWFEDLISGRQSR